MNRGTLFWAAVLFSLDWKTALHFVLSRQSTQFNLRTGTGLERWIPVPVKIAVSIALPPLLESETITDAVILPMPLGVNVTEIVQLRLAARELPQVVAIRN